MATAAERQAKRRKGLRQINIELTQAEWNRLQELRLIYNGNNTAKAFYHRALMTGAVFCANSGKPKGEKIK